MYCKVILSLLKVHELQTSLALWEETPANTLHKHPQGNDMTSPKTMQDVSDNYHWGDEGLDMCQPRKRQQMDEVLRLSPLQEPG